jgi:hypothetical protein
MFSLTLDDQTAVAIIEEGARQHDDCRAAPAGVVKDELAHFNSIQLFLCQTLCPASYRS